MLSKFNIMKTLVLFLLISFNTSAQFLSQSSSTILKTLNEQKIPYKITTDYYGYDTITVIEPKIKTQFVINRTDICRTEVITALTDASIVDMRMDLDEEHYITMYGVTWREEDYGVVEVKINGNIFTFSY